LTYFSRLLY